MTVYRHILVPLDASELDARVLDTALATASWADADVILLHVMPQSTSLEPDKAAVDLNVIDRQIHDMVARAKVRAESIAPTTADRIRAEVRSGDIVEAIASAVAELHIDLVIMGTHGRKGMLEAFTGSTTEQALRTVPASVFVVRPEGFPFLTE